MKNTVLLDVTNYANSLAWSFMVIDENGNVVWKKTTPEPLKYYTKIKLLCTENQFRSVVDAALLLAVSSPSLTGGKCTILTSGKIRY